MKVWDLVTACQNQWKETSLFEKNPNFKIQIDKNEETYHFDCDYFNQDKWFEIRDEHVISFEFKNETLHIKICSGI